MVIENNKDMHDDFIGGVEKFRKQSYIYNEQHRYNLEVKKWKFILN